MLPYCFFERTDGIVDAFVGMLGGVEADYIITADDISKYVGETDTRYGYEYF